jgi:hypothetical protein
MVTTIVIVEEEVPPRTKQDPSNKEVGNMVLHARNVMASIF